MAASFLDAWRALGRQAHPSRSGELPAPLDARNGSELAGAEGSHILPFVDLDALLRPTTDAFTGGFEVEEGALVGGEIRARLRAKATKKISARGAAISVVGYLIREVQRSVTHKRGDSTYTERWVEVQATPLECRPLIEVPLPVELVPGDPIDLEILAPAPRLGPPSVHAGIAAVVWTLQASWDIPLAADQRIAAIVPVSQHPDLVRSGVMTLGPSALLADWGTDGASMSVRSALPHAPGSPLELQIRWPDASGGRGARVELYVDLSGGSSLRLASVEVATASLASGVSVAFEIPADAPPIFDAPGLSLRYRVRALIDRPFRPDSAIERNVAIA